MTDDRRTATEQLSSGDYPGSPGYPIIREGLCAVPEPTVRYASEELIALRRQIDQAVSHLLARTDAHATPTAAGALRDLASIGEQLAEVSAAVEVGTTDGYKLFHGGTD